MRRLSLTGSHISSLPLFTALLCLALTACGGNSSSDATISIEPSEGGSLSPASRELPLDTIARFTFTTEPGYELQRISGCGGFVSGNRYVTAPVTEDCTISANFRLSVYDVVALAGPNGTISPRLETVTIESSATFTLEPDPGYRVAQVTGCDGTLEDGTYTVSGVTRDCIISAQFETDVYTLSGTISAAALTTHDTTLNDAFAAELLPPDGGDNDTFASAKFVNNRATISGFASAVGTDVACDLDFPERYREEPNPTDYYQVTLQEGQLIQLQVANFERHTGACENDADLPRPLGDLSLTLFDQYENEVEGPKGGTEYQEITVPESGDYVLRVKAESGISRYVLRLLPENAQSMIDDRLNTANAEFVPGEMLVKYRPQSDQRIRTATSSGTADNIQPVRRESIAPFRSRQTFPNSSTSSSAGQALSALQQRNPEAYARLETINAIKARRKDPAVEYAEPNYIRHALREPSDPNFVRQWHYNAINLTQAWDITVGESASGPAPIVAILDTGVVLNHPDLENKLVPGYDFVRDPDRSNDNDPGIDSDPSDPGDGDGTTPDSWHGTHVAGTVAAEANNGTGGTGVSWGARIMPMRVLGIGGGTSYDVMQGVRYAAGLRNDSGTLPERRADIINLSLGGPGFSQSEADLYARIRDEQGVILVASAGNEGSNTRYYPAAYPSVLSVGATNALGERAPYSNFGDTIALVAPGGYLREDANGDGFADGIFSTSAERRNDTIEPRYSLSYQGTSMAAPHVSGVLALMKAVVPDLSPDDVETLLLNGALTGSDQRTDELGYGQIDAYQAVMAIQDGAVNIDELPRINLTPSRLNLGTTATARVTLTNEGGGDPQLVQLSVDEPWLSVTPSAETEASASAFGDYQVSVDRQFLDEGFYQNRATFTWDNGTETRLRVYMQVGELSTEGELTVLYVLLTDQDAEPGEGQFVPQTIALPDEDNPDSARFEFNNIPPGRYSLVAGSDIDADGVICQVAEQCGAYPSLEREQVIEITDTDRTDLNFVASILGGFIDSSALSSNDPQRKEDFDIALPRSPSSETGNTRRQRSQDF